jgi:hypothetical protein
MVVLQQSYTSLKKFLLWDKKSVFIKYYQNTSYIYLHGNISTFLWCVCSILQDCNFKFSLSQI